ncbi:hypothetical protein [Enhydrobacter aerosaccus]|nr:hypothetical protein [Enhydrobacter aerosaccus]
MKMRRLHLPGTRAWREYRVPLPSGITATIAFALADPAYDFWTVAIAREQQAVAFGLLAIMDAPGEPHEPMLWTFGGESVSILPDDDDLAPSEAVRQILPRYLAMFFDDIKDTVPELTAMKMSVGRRTDRRSDRSLH